MQNWNEFYEFKSAKMARRSCDRGTSTHFKPPIWGFAARLHREVIRHVFTPNSASLLCAGAA